MLAIYKRKVRSYFNSMIGCVFAAFLTIIGGVYFMVYNLYSGYPFFAYSLAGVIFMLLISVPVLSMKSFAEDRKNKTDQLLLTSPVSLVEIVLGKYLAMVTVFAIPCVIYCIFPLIIKLQGTAHFLVDYSSILAFFLLGCVFIAIGMFLSSLTESPVIAAITTCAALFFFYLLDNLLQYFPSSAISNLVIWIIIFALIGLLIYHITKNQMIAGIVTGIGCIAGIVVYFVKKTLLESLEIDLEQLEEEQQDNGGYEKNGYEELSGYTGEGTELVLPSSIEDTVMSGVASLAFKDNTKITSVEVPEGMRYIDVSAFEGCTGLKKITLPDSLTWIGGYAFSGCTSLETVVFGNQAVEIEGSAFRDCVALRDVELPASENYLWDSAFCGAGAGGYIHIGDGSTVKGCCFMDSGFEEAVFGKECIFEGFGTFSGSKIKKITLGEGITELPSTFASFCDNLEQVDMPESLTKIPDDCFSASPKMEKEQ